MDDESTPECENCDFVRRATKGKMRLCLWCSGGTISTGEKTKQHIASQKGVAARRAKGMGPNPTVPKKINTTFGKYGMGRARKTG